MYDLKIETFKRIIIKHIKVGWAAIYISQTPRRRWSHREIILPFEGLSERLPKARAFLTLPRFALPLTRLDSLIVGVQQPVIAVVLAACQMAACCCWWCNCSDDGNGGIYTTVQKCGVTPKKHSKMFCPCLSTCVHSTFERKIFFFFVTDFHASQVAPIFCTEVYLRTMRGISGCASAFKRDFWPSSVPNGTDRFPIMVWYVGKNIATFGFQDWSSALNCLALVF